MNHLNTPIAFIATEKPEESRHFYETMLSLECVSDDPYAIVFNVGATMLRIQKVDTLTLVGHTVLGWEVQDIQNCVEDLTKKGVQFERFSQLPQDELGVWSSPSGASVAWFKDPDGNTLSLTQLTV